MASSNNPNNHHDLLGNDLNNDLGNDLTIMMPDPDIDHHHPLDVGDDGGATPADGDAVAQLFMDMDDTVFMDDDDDDGDVNVDVDDIGDGIVGDLAGDNDDNGTASAEIGRRQHHATAQSAASASVAVHPSVAAPQSIIKPPPQPQAAASMSMSSLMPPPPPQAAAFNAAEMPPPIYHPRHTHGHGHGAAHNPRQQPPPYNIMTPMGSSHPRTHPGQQQIHHPGAVTAAHHHPQHAHNRHQQAPHHVQHQKHVQPPQQQQQQHHEHRVQPQFLAPGKQQSSMPHRPVYQPPRAHAPPSVQFAAPIAASAVAAGRKAPPEVTTAGIMGKSPPPIPTTLTTTTTAVAITKQAPATKKMSAPPKQPAASATKPSTLSTATSKPPAAAATPTMKPKPTGKQLKLPPPNINPNAKKITTLANSKTPSKINHKSSSSKASSNNTAKVAATSTNNNNTTLKSPLIPKAATTTTAPKPKEDDDNNNGNGSNNNNNNPLLDPKVVPAVHSIISLLQTYGPLSYEQLKFNMVPQLVPVVNDGHPPYSPHGAGYTRYPPLKPGQAPPVIQPVGPQGTGVQGQQQEQPQQAQMKKPPRDRLLKVLDILHELGVIHLVDKSKLKGAPDVGSAASSGGGKMKSEKASKPVAAASAGTAASSASKAGAATTESSAAAKQQQEEEDDNDPNPIYFFGNGIPRMDAVMPSNVLTEIKKAGEEVLRTKQRIEILRKGLLAGMEGEKKGEDIVTGGVQGQVQVQGGNNNKQADGTIPASATTGAAGKQLSPKKGRPPKRKRKSQQSLQTPYRQARAVLQQLYSLHPDEVSRDPVYAAALRMFRVNVSDETQKSIVERHGMVVENSKEMDALIEAGVNFGKSGNKDGTSNSGSGGGGTLGKSKKRASGSSSQSLGGAGAGEGVSGKKKRKKGRPPKNANSSSEKLKQPPQVGGGTGETLPAVRANASWI